MGATRGWKHAAMLACAVPRPPLPLPARPDVVGQPASGATVAPAHRAAGGRAGPVEAHCRNTLDRILARRSRLGGRLGRRDKAPRARLGRESLELRQRGARGGLALGQVLDGERAAGGVGTGSSACPQLVASVLRRGVLATALCASNTRAERGRRLAGSSMGSIPPHRALTSPQTTTHTRTHHPTEPCHRCATHPQLLHSFRHAPLLAAAKQCGRLGRLAARQVGVCHVIAAPRSIHRAASGGDVRQRLARAAAEAGRQLAQLLGMLHQRLHAGGAEGGAVSCLPQARLALSTGGSLPGQPALPEAAKRAAPGAQWELTGGLPLLLAGHAPAPRPLPLHLYPPW